VKLDPELKVAIRQFRTAFWNAPDDVMMTSILSLILGRQWKPDEVGRFEAVIFLVASLMSAMSRDKDAACQLVDVLAEHAKKQIKARPHLADAIERAFRESGITP
jgi:hypothetical protein